MNLSELRPLSLGELLDRAFGSYRQHFWTFVGIMALPQVCAVAISLLQQGLAGPMSMPRPDTRTPALASSAGELGGSIVTLIVFLVVYSAALGATALAVSEFYLGRSITIGQAYRRLRGRVGKIIATILLQGLSTGGLVAVPLIAAALTIPLMARAGLAVIGGLITVLVVMGLLVVAVIMMLRLAVAVPALVLENLTAAGALRRSFRLSKDYAGRIFLIALLMGMISLIAAMVFQFPFWVALALVAVRHGGVPFWLAAPMDVSAGIGAALSAPLLLIALALAYYDMRVRKEGFDLQLMMASLGPGGPAEAGSGNPA